MDKRQLGTECYDHLGNKYNSITSMCKAYGVNKTTFKFRISQGASIEEALTGTFTQKRVCYDHLGNKYKSQAEMCKAYDISCPAFNYRLRNGWTVEEALTSSKNYRIWHDHLGNSYKSMTAMCKAYNIGPNTFDSRLKRGYSVKEALTNKKSDKIVGQGTKCEDHLGNSFESIEDMAKYWNTKVTTLKARLKQGLDVEAALTKPITTGIGKPCNDSIGNNYTSIADMTKAYNKKRGSILDRLVHQNGIELIVACVSEDRFSLRFIGLDNKAYYSVAWSNNYVTARQIVEHYRPDLLAKYDEYNPTGEYNPYRG